MSPRKSAFRTARPLLRARILSIRLTPLASAIALLLVTGSASTTAFAQHSFSPAWFANKGAAQASAAATGRLPNGMPASLLTSPRAQQQQSNEQLQRSVNNLNLAARGIAAQQAAQAMARQAAMDNYPSVPDGLADGGLKVDTNSLTSGWLNAQAPVQTTAQGETNVKIQQTADRAILNWETFNVGKHTTVQFDQQQNWAVLNRVNDPLARPSQIQGRIKADGTVMVVNRNGIVFSGSSQVDTRNLVAAAARIDDAPFKAGGIYGSLSGGDSLPSFTDAAGKIVVEAGARIATAAPATATQGGGYVLLLGREVINSGAIDTPRGQAALAAGDSFAIRKGASIDANASSTTRGNEISPQVVAGSGAGLVANTGLITAREGDITLAGHEVRQDGVAIATTTVNNRGTIHLLNSAADVTGRVTLGGRATTAVLIDNDGRTTALDSQRDALAILNGNARAIGQFDNLSTLPDRLDQSRVEIVSGGLVDFEGGSMTLATGGQIVVSAARRAFVASGATLDVAGAVGVQVAMESNSVLVNVQGNEQRDAPLNRDSGKLNNNDVWIDTRRLLYVPAGVGGYASDRYYTEGGLLEVGGYLGTRGHTIGEWAAQGGTVVLGGGEVVTQTGSRINLSGGSIDVATGYLKQTWLTGPGGRLYNASSAPADIPYSGVYKGFEDAHARWGDRTTDHFYNPLIGPQRLLENGYTVGRDAGQLIVSAPTAVLEGDVAATVYNGPRQVDSRPANVADGYRLAHDAAALGGRLVVGQYTGLGLVGGLDSALHIGDVADVTGNSVRDAAGMAPDGALPDERIDTVWLDASRLSTQALGGLTLVGTGKITVDAPLKLANGGQLTLTGPQIDVRADITAHGGAVHLGNVLSRKLAQQQAPIWVALTDAQGNAQVSIANGSTIDLSGPWVNLLDGSAPNASGLAVLDGGTLDVATTGGVTLAAGSTIDVSSGAAILVDGKTRGGKGGDVSLVANDDSRVPGREPGVDRVAPLVLDGKIVAHGFNGGGTLTLKAGQTVVVGEDATLSGGHLAAGTPASTSLRLADDVVIQAGGTMPFDYDVVWSTTPPDTPLPVRSTPMLNSQHPLVAAAQWVVPAGMTVFADGAFIGEGGTVPAGARIDSLSDIPAGIAIPSSVFRAGIPIFPVVAAAYKAGDAVLQPVTLSRGMVVPAGARFGDAVAIQPVLALNPDLFSTGFSSYAVSSNTGMEVAASVTSTVPVYRFDAASRLLPTGSRVSDAADLWLPPVYFEDPVAARLSQRAGASLALTSFYDFNLARGSAVAVDSGQGVAVHADRQATLDGAITAHGGRIVVTSVPAGTSHANGTGLVAPTRSIWIGEDGTLDVSAQAQVAIDSRGRRYGLVPDGGAIILGDGGKDDQGRALASDAFIVIRPGAVLDASGTAATIDVASAAGLQRTLVGSDGGAISLYSASGMHLDGELRAAAGAAGASGGALGIHMLVHALYPSLPSPLNPYGAGAIAPEMQRLRNVTIVQHDRPAALAAGLAPGERDPALRFGEATISVDRIHVGGFDQLALSTHDLFVFEGNVDLATRRSIALSGGIIAAGISGTAAAPGSVRLAAPYVKLDGWYNDASATIVPIDRYYPGLSAVVSPAPSTSTAPDSSFRVDANLIDVSAAVRFGVHGGQGSGSTSFIDPGHSTPANPQGAIVEAPGFDSVVLHSEGDIRFGTGVMTTNRSLTIEAAQLYPLSGATAVVSSGQAGSYDPAGTIAIRKVGDAVQDVPASVFGRLGFIGPNIDQGGVVRAPLGVVSFNDGIANTSNPPQTSVILREGSLTSTSAKGLILPFGGTSDGVSYRGASGTAQDLGSMIGSRGLATGVSIYATSVTGEAGAVLDVSGGGSLMGAGFVSGRGGSVDVLTTALANANPTNVFGGAGDKAYAIVPGRAPAYAPLIADKGAGDPAIGQQVMIPTGVEGLPAGTYTLLPSSYTLLPDAYRVEIGGKTTQTAVPVGLPSGSMVADGYLGVANTTIRDALPTRLILTPGQTVRAYSKYNETSYADFLRTQASLFDGIRPRLPVDGGILLFALGMPASGKALSFAGTALFDGAEGGVAGTLGIQTSDRGGILDITAPGQAATSGHVAVAADDINAFKAPSVVIGGTTAYDNGFSHQTGPRIYFGGETVVNVLDGAVLRAGQIFLVGPSINLAGGASLDTRGLAGSGVDSMLGYAYGNTNSEVEVPSGPAVLAVANGWFNFLPFVGSGSIRVETGASLLTEGSIVLGAPGSLAMGDANLGARFISVTQDTVNVGTAASLASARAAGRLPAGWDLTQDVLGRLLRPSTSAGVPALEQLTVVAGGSVNLVGDVALDARGRAGSDIQFVVNSPAIYGLAAAGEGARITADTFVWNGVRTGNGSKDFGGVAYGSKEPPPIAPNGPGTGAGTLDIAAQTVLFGYGSHSRVTDGVTLDRHAIGFSEVDIEAGSQFTANSDGRLFVGLGRDPSGNPQGGNLNITAALLGVQQGASMAFNAGGAVRIAAPAGGATPDASRVTALGGTLSFKGDSIALDTVVALPSGKLTLDAVNDITLGEQARIDLSGRHLTFYDKTVDSWGGDLVLRSARGNIAQRIGSLIDVSAQDNVAGTVTASAVDAAHGTVSFDGTIKGAANSGYASGGFDVQAQDIGDFAALNRKLNDAGFFDARSFDIKRGNLVIGSEVKARSVSISVDGGSLSVDGTIDASGAAPGTIRLAARDNLTLASSAVLDTHASKLKTDSRGSPIEAENTAHVELASAAGFVNLEAGATIDMRSADNVARGKLEIDASRRGGAGGPGGAGGSGANDIAINAAEALRITGAASIAVNGFRSYALPGGSTIDQAYLDAVHADSRDFIDAAQANGALQGRLAGLTAYGPAFHLRPGVEIVSDGNLSTSGDLDFAGYRYGPKADGVVLGSGEPGKLVVRAGGDLNINGSVTDGFGAPPSTPDENGFQSITPRTIATEDVYPVGSFRLAESWTIPNDDFYNNNVILVFTADGFYFPGDTIPAGSEITSAIGAFAWEAGLMIPALAIPGAPKPVQALARPLAPGSLSWSMRLAAGADIAAADSRVLRSASSLGGAGNLTLSDLHVGGSDNRSIASVIRTGTGDLELLAGGNYTQMSPYGIYTAGTPIAETGTAANAPYNPARGTLGDGTVLGGAYSDDTLGPEYMYYMAHGGDLRLTAQGNVNGTMSLDSKQVGGWLWREGGAELGQSTAWGINFGSYTAVPGGSGPVVHLSTFSGVGTLGGGNVDVQAGGNIGEAGNGLVMAIGGSGRVMADGNLVQTGGGTLSVKAGGNIGTGSGQFVNLRGDTRIATGDFGRAYGSSYGYDGQQDPRSLDPFRTYAVAVDQGASFVPGDGAISIRARGDVAVGNLIDPGRAGVTQQTDASATQGAGHQGATWFTLWSPTTAIDVFGAGGSVSPWSVDLGTGTTSFAPPILRVTAGSGDIYLNGGALMLPSVVGELQLLAQGSVVGNTSAIGPLSTSPSALATPQHPAWASFKTDRFSSTLEVSNYWGNPTLGSDVPSFMKAYSFDGGGTPFVFSPNTVSDASAFKSNLGSRIYAVSGDILNLTYGEVYVDHQSLPTGTVDTTYYRAAKPVDILAGGDIVNLSGLVLHNDPSDVSVVAASRNVIYAGGAIGSQRAGLQIAGPGTLELSAGGNIYQGSVASIESIGPLVSGDKRPGASVVLQAGLGEGVPGDGQVDWSGFARRYLDARNLVASGPLAGQSGKVARTYEVELASWLWGRFAYAGAPQDALAYFLALPEKQQRVFLRTVYYAELTAGGREYNDETGPRPGSYLRGREAIATLFPHAQAYDGDLIAFTTATANPSQPGNQSVSGYVHTNFGGDIQLLAPGGGITIGSEGVTAGPDAGLITQGNGSIQIYSRDSLLLGLSRIMTTFGGDILAWSAEGDINAGRGSKTTVIFTPPKRSYDELGNVTLAPQVPSTGAGIATLRPIAEVPAGDIDLIAPLGTIDAGEAGIRVSGNVNLAALQVVNAANIQVQGKSTGLPLVASVNVGALTSASAVASQATIAAQDMVQRERAVQRQSLPSVFTVRVLGFGNEPLEGGEGHGASKAVPVTYDPNSSVVILGLGEEGATQRAHLTPRERKDLAK